MTHGQPSRPANVLNIVAINQGQKPLSTSLPQARALTVQEAQGCSEEGGIFLDTRGSHEFGAGHIPGAFNIQLIGSQFEQRVGWVIPGDAPLILILAEDSQAQAALQKLAYIGLENRVTGYLAGGISAWIRAGLPTSAVPQIIVGDLYHALQHGGLTVLDVREANEWNAGHLTGAQQRSYKDLDISLGELALDPAKPVAVFCAGGMRSSTAASILLRHGFTGVSNVVGGMEAWRTAGLPVVQSG